MNLPDANYHGRNQVFDTWKDWVFGTEKIGYLILVKMKFWNLKSEHFEKRAQIVKET